MSEEDTSTAGLGERRRRREAERARAAAEGLERPMTRREMRARDEALASGALQLGPDGPVPTPMSAVSGQSGQSGHSAYTAPSAGTPATADAERAVADPADAVGPATMGASTTADAATDDPTATEAATDDPTATDAATTGGTSAGLESADAVTPDPAPADPAPAAAWTSDPATGDVDAATTGEFGVSRRSLRAKQASADAEPASPEAPSERTGTGRRPVVRPPAAARATRGLDETGGLTPIQRAVRDINAATDTAADPPRDAVVAERSPAPSPGPLPSTDAASTWGSEASDVTAVLPVTDVPAGREPDLVYDGGPLPVTRRSSRSYPAEPASTASTDAAGTEHSADPAEVADGADESDDSFDMAPRWASVISGESDDGAVEAPALAASSPEAPAAASAGSREELLEGDHEDEDYDEFDDDEDEDEGTPGWLRALQIIVLILVGLVLGLLVWQVAIGNVFGGSDGLAALAATAGPDPGVGSAHGPAA
ncbi:hypothetical protein EXU48_19940 [Occultella glacieicola]|uniref:Uncharacterized protein n=1 Tax=Occultella glacieicola TaxID=2518684 RepID=A0ABY2DYX2_9MICO|nr:hypothetical protein [Occultella glacieicola]TDE89692.1 hypothetical protein EXU48_19940 [Occultella glacieicola]